MTANPHLAPQLDAYLAQAKPGFAIMVNASWGAGKTFAVKSWLGKKPHLYVSLFGVDNIRAIEDVLFQALLDGGHLSSTGKLKTKAIEGLSAIFSTAMENKTGISVDFASIARNLAFKVAPSLIIFDDLERAQIPAPQLLSIINRFVEHEKKSVILIANEAELDPKSIAPPQPLDESAVNPNQVTPPKNEYRKWREKVVGRTITLKPEVDLAFDAILAEVQPTEAQTFLTKHRGLICGIFLRSETENLRLLRQSLVEFGRFFAQISNNYRSQAEPMAGLLGTYLALSIAWHAGDRLIKEDFERDIENPWRRAAQKDKTKLQTGIDRLRQKCEGISQINLEGQYLPFDLASRLIIDGHATDDEIEAGLAKAYLFAIAAKEPWQILWAWRHNEEADVNAALASVRAQLTAHELTNPNVILHIFGVMLGMARLGAVEETEAEVLEHAISYIAFVEAESRFSWNVDADKTERWLRDDNSLGLGYAELENSNFATIRDVLIAALSRLWKAAEKDRLRQLLDLARDKPSYFWMAIEGSGKGEGIPSFSNDPVFLAGDPIAIAEEIFNLPTATWYEILSPLRRRLLQDEKCKPEQEWFRKFCLAANAIADTSTPIRREQIRSALDWNLSFLDSVDETSQTPVMADEGNV